MLLRAATWGGPISVLRLWRHWEPLAMRAWRVRPVRKGAVLQFGASPYRGPSTVLADGTFVEKGSPILHLHLDNGRVSEVVRIANGNVWAIAPRLNEDLDELARLVASGAVGRVEALRGITVHAAMARRFGFEVRPLPHNLRWALVHGLGVLVAAVYGPRDSTDVVDRGAPWPGELWMSRRALLNRGGVDPADP
jgi:hypothetical protein